MSLKPVSVPQKKLAQSITSASTTFKLNSILGWDGNELSASDFGTQAFGAFLSADKTRLELFEWDPSTIADPSITILYRGLNFDGTQTTEVAANKLDWAASETTVLLGTDTPQFIDMYVGNSGDETLYGVKTFDESPIVPTGGTGTQAANHDDIAAAVSGASGTATESVFGTVKLSVAAASAPNPISVGDNDPRVPTQAENDALAGTSGSPSSSNKYVTNDDTSTSGASGKVVRLNGTSYPPGDGSAITGNGIQSYTASGAIAQNDAVYVSAASTVKSLYPSAQGTGASISTTPSTATATRSLPLSTNGVYLHITGGDKDTSGVLYAQVRTINAAETDLSNGTEYAIYSTGNGTRGYDVKSIGTDKFLFIFNADTAGVTAGIKCVVATVSGTTVTVGSVTTIETTGDFARIPSVAKLDTDKGLIFYQKDSDSDLYCQVLSISGTSITTNTPASVKVTSNNITTQAVQLATDSASVVYSESGSSTIYGKTISVSSTTPTVNSEQTIVTMGSSGQAQIGLYPISSTKLMFTYCQQSTPTNDTMYNIAISGATMTPSSSISLSSARKTNYFGFATIGTKYALVIDYASATTAGLFLIDISGTAPVQISTQTLTTLTNSDITLGYSIVKISPWTYIAEIGGRNTYFIVKLTVVSTARIGMAQSAILDTASGSILMRYSTQTLSSITLTPGSIYYVDDTAQPTVNSSLTSPTLGVAISTTKILLQ